VGPLETGVIGHIFDLDKMKTGAAAAVSNLSEDGPRQFDAAIHDEPILGQKPPRPSFQGSGATIKIRGSQRRRDDIAANGNECSDLLTAAPKWLRSAKRS